jgi:hypothetical protein
MEAVTEKHDKPLVSRPVYGSTLLGILSACKLVCQSANFINHDEPRQPIRRNLAFALAVSDIRLRPGAAFCS